MEKKLISSIQSNSYKIVELYNKLDSETLITGPDFQRNLVWKKQHKYAFIQTILLNYPFPEVYVASQQLDVANLKAIEIVVDGQQRLTTIEEYIKGIGDFHGKISIKKFDELSLAEKKDFLNYPVSVKDLKDLDQDTIIQIFKRINSTNYSLNSNEMLNAEFGGGEFAYYAKQLTTLDFDVDPEYTDVVIDKEDRKKVVDFFTDKGIFTDNDIKRMFDSQYIMLLTSTIMDGAYSGRSSKVEHYLKAYNDEFENYQTPLNRILNSIRIIEGLGFDKKSYWFNKPNLFSLLVELRDINPDEIDFTILETKLWELERKVDVYFTADSAEDMEGISDDEKKYFEYARQGSHELQAREYRGRVIREIIGNALIKGGVAEPVQEEIDKLKAGGIDFAVIIPTETGLKKHIMDATLVVRDFLRRSGIHDYSLQENGPEHKVKIQGVFVVGEEGISTEISMYKSNGRGDCRIWFSGLNEFAQSGDELAVFVDNNIVKVSKLDK